MGQLENIVNVTITAQTTSPTREGFGTPMCLAYHTRFAERFRKYTSTAAMLTDGFVVSDPAYKMVQAAFSQNPRPKEVVVGRRALPPTHTIRLTPKTAVEGQVYKITVKNSPETEYTYTVLAAATIASVCTALTALIGGHAGVTAADNTTHVTLTSQVGVGTLLELSAWSDTFLVEDVTADPGIATDLGAVWDVNKDWYGLAIDSNSKAEVVAAAAWVESNKRLFIAQTSDSVCKDSVVTTDVMSSLKTLNYKRTSCFFSNKHTNDYRGAAWQSRLFPYDPGSSTWKFKTLSGIATDTLTDTEISNLVAKNGNVYIGISGVAMTLEGKVASGEFIDITHFIDWVESEMKVRVFALLVNNQKVPYTDFGVDMVVNVMQSVLTDGVRVGGLSPDPAPVASGPKVADVAPAIRATRVLPDLKFEGRLAGAIHNTTIAGTLSV